MKLTGILLLMALLHVSAAGISQKITLSVKNAPLTKVLDQIKEQTGLSFLWDQKEIASANTITLDVKEATVTDVLDACFRNQGLSYTMLPNMVVIKKIILNEHVIEPGPPLPPVIHGRIVDSTGTPMAGVSVVVKGTRKGTSTDEEGRFELNDVPDNATLVISGANIQRLELAPGDKTDLTITVKPKISGQEEVVINAGYYKVNNAQSTGNISRVDAKTIADQPVNNVLQTIEGRMPGVYVQQTTGVPGGGYTIEIQGRNSLRTDGNNPLYIIDGVPFTSDALTSTIVSGSIITTGSPLASINPNDVESIEVLKDADATAIYGSRGANGVVLITLKKGKAGKTKVEGDLRLGFGTVSQKLNILNTPQYLEMRNEAFKNDGITPTPNNAVDLMVWDTTRNTDWQKELIGGTSKTTNAQITISGGSPNTQFSFGGGYYRETTVFPGDLSFQRASGNLSLNHSSSDQKFRATVLVNYTSINNNLIASDFTNTALTLSPDAPALYDSAGNINDDWKNGFIQNPLLSLRRTYSGKTDNLVSHIQLDYKVLPGLIARIGMGYTTMNVNEITTGPISSIPRTFQTPSTTGSSAFGNAGLKTWILEPQLDYSKKWGAGMFNATVGATYQGTDQNGETLSAYGFTSDALLENIQAATSIYVSSTSNSSYRYAAVFGRLNYNWNEKYILNLTGRRDGSSRFGPGQQFGNFGAAGAAWLFSNEDFVKSALPFLNFGKLRASYGITGSDAIGNYQYLNTYTSTSFPYNNTSGLVVSRLANPDYSWETNKKLEFGLELGVLHGRINALVNWYQNRCSNQLVGLPLPTITGESSVQYNFPATVQNMGWEISMNSTNIVTHEFKWTSTFNITFPTNKLIEFPNIEAFPAYSDMYEVGKSIYYKKTFKSTGVNPATGLYTFFDANHDGNISYSDDRFFLKQISRQFFGGFNNSFFYKGFELDIFFQFVKQTGENYLSTFYAPGNLSNQPTVVMSRWRNPGDITNIQKFTAGYSPEYGNQQFSDQYISDASFIRLKNASLSWQLPSSWMKKARVESSKIFLQGQNLFTSTHYLGMDPENQNVSFLPPLRVIAFGIQIIL